MSDPNPYAADGDPNGAYQWGPVPGYGYPDAAPGYGYPQHPVPYAGPPPGFAAAPLMSVGDITVMPDSIVTPSGTMPLKGAVWTVTDMSRTEERMPAVAIVLAVVFFVFCLLGLLFLLMKEKVTTGYVQVTVTSGGRHHSTVVPALGPHTFPLVMGQVNYARSLCA
ncbi:hypothetical protein AR457_13855 [Streptomyces agglomeratus]|uniref:Uncharacterized protein n=1 Tax=Streptomyces agglomeratus TaxID=285458 RepID=A0A1E5P769_9ACTN|nr:hypothetical protein [Streptomyces agglomeratus]OEJ25382.1 hypothetical protein AS594_13680 [Streptomyces agglomeratus]OEJ40580.1 hypothetical protein BGK70_22795 [Streptomyces agglomeratus]OEJ45039.1 hypothetical protein AR457_13855 [Streptomyces agglomeratus]OEJ53130.1 hypothetical protein BGK72_22425 [Streptomyces agglomeratus]OEJ60465.1 hypothetical protein BGM19_23130 [Streptomyces agglomeratus]